MQNALRNADIRRISLVRKGANGQRIFLYKSADGVDVGEELPPGKLVFKAGGDWEGVYCVVAAPNVDEEPGLFGDQSTTDVWDDPEEIRKAAWRFMENGGGVNHEHGLSDMPEDFGKVVENAIALDNLQVNTPDGVQTIRKGSWYVAIKPTDEGKQLIKSGEVTGVSIQGEAERVAKAATQDGPIREAVQKLVALIKGESGAAECDCGCSGLEVDDDAEELGKAAFNAADRRKLPSSAFVFPAKAPGSGSYPIPDRAHGANALARSKGTPQESAVRAAVCKRFSDLPACQSGIAKDGGKVEDMDEAALNERFEKVEKLAGDTAEAVTALTGDEGAIAKLTKGIDEKFEAITKRLPAEKDESNDEPSQEDKEKAVEGKIEKMAEGLAELSQEVEALAKGSSSQKDDPPSKEELAKSEGERVAAEILA